MTPRRDAFKQKREMVFIRRPSLLNSAQIQTHISDEGLNPNAQETISVLSFALKILMV